MYEHHTMIYCCLYSYMCVGKALTCMFVFLQGNGLVFWLLRQLHVSALVSGGNYSSIRNVQCVCQVAIA